MLEPYTHATSEKGPGAEKQQKRHNHVFPAPFLSQAFCQNSRCPHKRAGSRCRADRPPWWGQSRSHGYRSITLRVTAAEFMSSSFQSPSRPPGIRPGVGHSIWQGEAFMNYKLQESSYIWIYHLSLQHGTRKTSENVFHFLLTHCMFEIKGALCFIGKFGCSQEILSIAAMMQIQNIFVVPSNQKSQAVSPVFFLSGSYQCL